MGREFIATDGRIFFRTKLLRPRHAEQFAACLCANRRFCQVSLQRSMKAQGEACCFVQYRPATSERQAAQLERQRAARAERAQVEGNAYQFSLDTDGLRPFYWLHNRTNGETYEVSETGCSCPDFQFRCQKLASQGLRCKHMVALERACEQGIIERLSDWSRSMASSTSPAALRPALKKSEPTSAPPSAA